MKSGNADWFGETTVQLDPGNQEKADALIEEIAALAREAGHARLSTILSENSDLAAFIAAACCLSPYIRDSLRRRPAILDPLCDMTLADRLDALNSEMLDLSNDPEITESVLMEKMRELKREAHCLIALSDLGAATAELTVTRMSNLAETCIRSAVRFVLFGAETAGKIKLPEPENPELGSGWILLAMGKLGAGELNFSSDIDLVAFYDSSSPAIIDRTEATDLFVRLTKKMARILNDRTGNGYVFRTDLRLRPDPGSTPLCIPVGAALNYYESRGQNWERAAMIKARPVAGDIAAAKDFLKELEPYIWRKYMDYATIADVHAIKRQIHAHKGHGEVAVKGHNVKLGRGGIREIEFFVQTQQLIAGGRFPELRGRRTTKMLGTLADRGWIGQKACEALVREYWFLRDIEHAIQIVGDEQIHNLPDNDEGLLRIARMRGFTDLEQFTEAFRTSLKTVEGHYAALFETEPRAAESTGNLVFTGDDDDPATLETLSNMGFERPADMCRIIRSWHFGRYRATHSADSSKRLTQLTPVLLEAFARTQRADEALLRFDEFLKGLPAGVQLFSLLQSNPSLLDLLVTIMGAAPRLASTITKRPHVFDGLLDPALLSELPDRDYLNDRLAAFLDGALEYEEVLDRLRIFAAEQKFLIGMRLLTGAIGADHAGHAFSDLADLTIGTALDAVIARFSGRYGSVQDGRVAVLAMGKLGSRELTAGSDVDLILLYDHAPDANESDGEKPLAPSQYYARLTQRLIAAVSAPTSEGVLYELDLRLRPSGNKGPVATHIDAFRKYQRESAWVWEHMALTRARPIAGDEAFCAEVAAEIEKVLARRHDRRKVLTDAYEMRMLIGKEKPPRGIWDIKLIDGGIIELEFIAQTAVLTGYVPRKTRSTETSKVLENLSTDFLAPQIRDDLVEAHRLYLTLTQIIRLCVEGGIYREEISPGLAETLLRSTDLPEIGVLEAHIKETSQRVRSHFETLLGQARGADLKNVRPPQPSRGQES